MKIDFSGFVPSKNIISGIASNLDVEQAIKTSSESYIKSMKNEADIIDNNLEKISALNNLKQSIDNLRNNITREVLPALSKKNITIDNPGYITAEITQRAKTGNFTISDVKTALPQQLKITKLQSITDPLSDYGFDTGIINIAPKSLIKKNGENLVLAPSDNIKKATITKAGHVFSIEKFTMNSPESIDIIIDNEKFFLDSPPDYFSQEINFISLEGNILTITIDQGFSIDRSSEILSNAFGIKKGTDIEIKPNDNLQDFVDKINNFSMEIKANAYVLQNAENKLSLIIKSNELGKEFVIYNSALLPEFTMEQSTEASLNFDGNYVKSNENNIELIKNEIFLHLVNDLPTDRKIKVSINLDIENIKNSLSRFVDFYNELFLFIDKQIEYDAYGKQTDKAILRDSNALNIIKNRIKTALIRKIDNKTLMDFGILINHKSQLYIDESKFNRASKNQNNFISFTEIMNNLIKITEEITGYNGTITKELAEITRNNESHANKIENLERKAIDTQAETYKKFTELEAKVANANYIIKLLEDQIRSDHKN
ncbi:MAG: flagellar filament capping protein FliD [Rickettsiaceae bacterium H1]|nr:flagellar filament capping protein FliD [Rickettsiaceae bacterium H1]